MYIQGYSSAADPSLNTDDFTQTFYLQRCVCCSLPLHVFVTPSWLPEEGTTNPKHTGQHIKKNITNISHPGKQSCFRVNFRYLCLLLVETLGASVTQLDDGVQSLLQVSPGKLLLWTPFSLLRRQHTQLLFQRLHKRVNTIKSYVSIALNEA